VNQEKALPKETDPKLPMPFILRRLHSLMGAWLILYLFEHLYVNAQAGFIFKDKGANFVRLANNLENIPFLAAVEIVFIGLPFLIHIVWGIVYLRQAKMNSFSGNGTKPQLPMYRRNRAFSWQRITSWLLIIGVIGHVVHMRFLSMPQEIGEKKYSVHVNNDPKLSAFGHDLDLDIEEQGKKAHIISNSPGMGFLLVLRDSFRNPLLVILYSAFVIAACYHAFNGAWTFLITWGIILTKRAQKNIRILSIILMWITLLFGLFAIWGMYFSYALT
jgi:succinate dehydrogenase / fumarate reductase, cytochrome b subunit